MRGSGGIVAGLALLGAGGYIAYKAKTAGSSGVTTVTPFARIPNNFYDLFPDSPAPQDVPLVNGNATVYKQITQSDWDTVFSSVGKDTVKQG